MLLKSMLDIREIKMEIRDIKDEMEFSKLLNSNASQSDYEEFYDRMKKRGKYSIYSKIYTTFLLLLSAYILVATFLEGVAIFNQYFVK